MIITRMALPRRTVLRGLGAMLSLPLLDAMFPALTAAAATPAQPARRLGFVYIPNGANMADWSPKGDGRGFEFSRTLKAIEPFREHVQVLSGLANQVNGAHAVAAASWLTGVAPLESLTNLKAAVTADQIAAQHLGKYTQWASLELGLEGADFTGACCGNYSCAYTNTVSWRNPTTPLPIETDPRNLFERMFGDGDSAGGAARLARLAQDRSILDSVKRDANGLQKKLGPTDREKLDQYFDAIRDVERRIQRAEEQNAENPVPEIAKPIGVPDSYDDYAKLMFDLQVLAYQSDLTRVTTFMLAKEISQRTYPQVGVADPHHSISHHKDQQENLEKLSKINGLHMQLFSYYLEKLRSTPDGDGSLLDHVMVVYGGGMSNSNVHSHTDLPTLVVGGGAGRLNGGYHRIVPKDTPMANLLVSLLEKLDVPVEKFSDSTGKLDLLSQI
jgi:hypothetical protein